MPSQLGAPEISDEANTRRDNQPASLRPKLLQDTWFLPTADGVLFRNATAACSFKGASIYPLVTVLVPYLNGTFTLDQLTAKMGQARGDYVRRLVQTLLDKGLVKHHDPEPEVDLPQSVLAAFAPQLEFLEHTGDAPRRRFAAFRGASVLVTGSGFALAALATGLARNGLEKVHVALPRRGELHPSELEAARAPDVPFEAWWHPPVAALSREELARFSVVVLASEFPSLHEIHELHERCRAAGVTFLPGFVVGGQSFIGPVALPARAGCWLCAISRLSANIEPAMAAAVWRGIAVGGEPPGRGNVSEPAARMLGTGVAFELFKHLAGPPRAESERALLVQDVETLETRRAPFAPFPQCSTCSRPDASEARASLVAMVEGRRDAPRSPSAQLEDASLFLHDRQVGLMRLFADDALPQIPLHASVVALGSPRDPSRPPAHVMGYAIENLHAARRAALGEALQAYALSIVDTRTMEHARASQLRARGEVVVAAESITSWAGGLARSGEETTFWLPAATFPDLAPRFVPAAAAYTDSFLNREGLFDDGVAGLGAGVTFDEAWRQAVLSLLCRARCSAHVDEGAPLFSLPAERLGEIGPTSAHLSRMLGHMSVVPRVDLVGDGAGWVALVRGEADGASLAHAFLAGGLTCEEALASALTRFLGALQSPTPTWSSASAEALFAGMHVSHDGARTPFDPARAHAAATLESVVAWWSGRGLDVLAIDMTPADLRDARYVVVRALLVQRDR